MTITDLNVETLKWLEDMDILDAAELQGRADIANNLRTALQTRTPPVPVDAINIKREVLAKVEVALRKISSGDMSGSLSVSISRVALASLDAVLSEGR